MSLIPSKLEPKDLRLAQILKWAPCVLLLLSLGAPLPFLFFYLRSDSTETSAISLLLAVGALGAGVLIGALILILFMVYRRRWYHRLRDRLASDGITASEVTWFTSELTSEERLNLSEIQKPIRCWPTPIRNSSLKATAPEYWAVQARAAARHPPH